VSDTTITPNFPLRTRVEIMFERSFASAADPWGDVHAVDAAGVAARRGRVRRVVRAGRRRRVLDLLLD
jgi:hypothetical protein